MSKNESFYTPDKADAIAGNVEQLREVLPSDLGVFSCEGGTYCVYTQAQVSWNRGEARIHGYEALLRDLVTGHVPTSTIEYAEQEGTIDKYTTQVFEQVVRACVQGLSVPISCNVLADELTDDFVAEITAHRNTLVSKGIDPRLLGIELVERSPITDEHLPILLTLHELGVHISLDDFGTGHATHSVARTLIHAGIDLTIKLDRVLAINGTVLDVARELRCEFIDIPLVAEGVEDLDQVTQLDDMRVLIQSFTCGGQALPLSRVV